MKVSDLLAEDALQLRLHTASTAARLARSISFCAPAEFLDPTPFLSPNCLLITNGIGFNISDDRTWDAYVERLAGVPVAAIAFVTGTAHRLIPSGLVRAASNHDVPLLEVPRVVPALQVHRLVTGILEAERFALTKQSWALADRCAKIVGGGGTMNRLLAEVSEAAQSQLAILDATGSVVAYWPQGSHWGPEDLSPGRTGDEAVSFELPMGGTDTYHLVARGRLSREPLATLLGPVSSILAIQLTNALRVAGSRQGKLETLLAQFGDWQGIALEELTRTFSASGFNPLEATFLVVARLDPADLSPAWKIRLAIQEIFTNSQLLTAQNSLYVFAQSPQSTTSSAAEVTRQVLASCRLVAGNLPIVIKDAADSVDELRLGLAGALHGVRHVSEPVIAAPLEIQALIAAAAGGGARAAARKLLAPVISYDQNHGSELLKTLQTYLKCNGQSSPTSRALYIHRNTLGNRLRLLANLLRLKLDTLDGQATCLMALRITAV
ncbi:MAG: PucR family transcriptional regulator ligand-binding domain-containing protein [Actinomycetota bacterium]|nr:PucR family transcriptional regulator ligand-binding domain-containing protein [Actinomycetota bacterium]